MSEEERPRLLIVAGPNGAGKTTATEAGLAHRWFSGCEHVNPDIIAERELGTDSPDINAAPVARRMLQGGHDVPIRKVLGRCPDPSRAAPGPRRWWTDCTFTTTQLTTGWRR